MQTFDCSGKRLPFLVARLIAKKIDGGVRQQVLEIGTVNRAGGQAGARAGGRAGPLDRVPPRTYRARHMPKWWNW